MRAHTTVFQNGPVKKCFRPVRTSNKKPTLDKEVHPYYRRTKNGRSVASAQFINPFAPGDFAEKRVLKLVEWFSGHYRAIKS